MFGASPNVPLNPPRTQGRGPVPARVGSSPRGFRLLRAAVSDSAHDDPDLVEHDQGAGEEELGKGRVLLECNTSSLRFVLVIPKATRAEKAEMKGVIEKGDDLFCPRHGLDGPLSKSGKNWVCNLCGVSFGKS